ncbi:hypothetical protein CC1G_09676 [Coprinopsis cinerea okayama7|uniref:Uncharacterized protein n=1 Tax=Coprinopsis cinerea (strain Okayama-7 / 130 / ATCC MYA-4618 / FGSC 9003) TaxID=240176 RepID=A8P9H5_COPC7|nr:hypothetical protein CC1G_09676 [Coprinopsis cinerea okayama7\|eukprot:XP_001839773.2 hypothetical protein CC1G_09676 [Coprinopsis cinerea okayama7\
MFRMMEESTGWQYLRGDELGLIGARRRGKYTNLPFVVDIWYFLNGGTGRVINVIITDNRWMSKYRERGYRAFAEGGIQLKNPKKRGNYRVLEFPVTVN